MAQPTLPQNNGRAELHWIDRETLGIRWSDGHASAYPLRELRAACPCALCAAARDKGLTLQRASKRPLEALEVQSVGRYAIQFVWNDGHRTGIYTYERLRRDCPCEQCRAGD